MPLAPRSSCVVEFTDAGVEILGAHGATASYGDLRVFEIGGAGAVTSGGGFMGGGFGATAAAEGMAVASVLNALTTKTKIDTVLRLGATDWQAYLHHDREVPAQLRMRLSRPLSLFEQARAAPAPAPAPAPVDLAGQLAQLVSLKDAGALTDDEFAAAKAKLLGT